MQKPPKLRAGDRIAAVTLSWGGPGTFPHRYEAGVSQLEQAFGVEVVPMPHTLAPPAEIAAHPERRAADLMGAFADPEIHGIVSTIGGEDSIRLLRHLDLDVIRANPKPFMGYSDTTVSHFACRRAGLVSFYGPSIMAGFGENAGLFPYMVDAVRRALFTAEPIGVIEPSRSEWAVEPLSWADPANQAKPRARHPALDWRWLQGDGVAEGPLIGGCFEVLEFLRGTSLWPALDEWQDAVLFLEASEEAPEPGEWVRWLRGYAAMGVLERASALLIGRPGGGIAADRFAEYDDAVLGVVARECGHTRLPIVTCMDFGHTDPMFVLPYGARARVDCERRELSIPEAGVTNRVRA